MATKLIFRPKKNHCKPARNETFRILATAKVVFKMMLENMVHLNSLTVKLFQQKYRLVNPGNYLPLLSKYIYLQDETSKKTFDSS